MTRAHSKKPAWFKLNRQKVGNRHCLTLFVSQCQSEAWGLWHHVVANKCDGHVLCLLVGHTVSFDSIAQILSVALNVYPPSLRSSIYATCLICAIR